jgi:glutaredoxin
VPALDALVSKFATEANTVVVGLSVDTKHSHLHWAHDLGGVSIPLLSDFHPRGAVAQKYGLYLENAGICDRATVIIDTDGIVRHASSVGVAGKRNIDELLELAKKVNRSRDFTPPAPKGRLSEDATLYVREGCRFCQATKKAIRNLHVEDHVRVRDVEKDPEARKALDAVAGEGAKVPALVQNGRVQHESGDIIRTLAELYALT